MAKDARIGAGVTRAATDSTGSSAKSNGTAKSPPGTATPEPKRSRFWPKAGTPFDPKPNVTAKPAAVQDSPVDAAVAPVSPMTWTNANKPISVGIGLSVFWLAIFSFYVTRTLGWSELFLLLPPEFGGLFAVGLMPIAFLWLLIAFIDRGRQLSQEGEALRLHLAQLTYPSADAAQQVEAVTASLKRQADALTEASKVVTERLQDLQSQFVRNTDKLSTVTGQLETGASTSAAAVTEQVDKLKAAIDWGRRGQSQD